jgi:hypothetical protein
VFVAFSFRRRGQIQPDAVGCDIRKKNIDLGGRKPVAALNLGPQQDVSILGEQFEGKQIPKSPGEHPVDNPGGRRGGIHGQEAGHDNVGVDEGRAGRHPLRRPDGLRADFLPDGFDTLFALVSETARSTATSSDIAERARARATSEAAWVAVVIP